MNALHRWICSSGHWKRHVGETLVPWSLDGLDLGDNILEIGPGYGRATDILRTRASRLTCVEVDHDLAHLLSNRLGGTNANVIQADGAQMPFRDAGFSAVLCFTMLHHIPSPALQDMLLAEVSRVLRPGGTFAGTDSVYSTLFGLLHIGDTMTMVDPVSFPRRLQAAGFTAVEVKTGHRAFRFRARTPPVTFAGTANSRSY